MLSADPERVIQIATNLLINAAKYTPIGGTIVLAAKREGTSVVIEVEDTGVGIAPDMLARIFDAFVRVPGSNDRYGSLGIGLTIVRQLVAQHHGTVTCRSNGIGHGATFTVRLPLNA